MEPSPEVGARLVSREGVIGMVLYKATMISLVIYLLAKLWPYPTPLLVPSANEGSTADAAPAANRPVTTTPTPPPAGATAPAAGAGSQPGQADSAQRRAALDSARRVSADSARITATDSTMIPIWLACRPELMRTYQRLNPRDYSGIPKCVYVFGTGRAIWDEQRLLFMVLLAGALGSLVHATRSLANYIGNRRLKWSWVPYYLLLPLGGASVALIFYVVIRGGFFSAGTDVNETNPFGFTGVAALVGLFSQAAILKLQKIAENIFERPETQSDTISGSSAASAAVITKLERKAQVAGGREDLVQITGTGFTETSKGEVNGKSRLAVFEGNTLLTITLEPAELAVLENGGELRIVVINDDKRSNEMVLQ